MLKLRSLIKEKADEAVITIVMGIFALVILFGGLIFMFFFVQMIADNILFIGLAITMVIAIPILAKAYFTKTTGKMYPEAKKE